MASPLDKPKGNEKPTTNQPTIQLLEEKMGSFSLVDSVHLKEKVIHLGTGVHDLDVRVQVLENSSPDAELQKELEQSKQEVCNLKEELSIVLKKLDKITAESQQDQEQLKDCQKKIQHLEDELEKKESIILRLEKEMGVVKEDLKTTKVDLQKTAFESRANKEDLASTKQELGVTKEDLATTKNELDQNTAAIEHMKQAIYDLQRKTGSSLSVQCTEDSCAAAIAVSESRQKGQRQTRRDQPQHTVQTSLTSSRSQQRERREQAAGQNPQAQPPTPRQTRQGSFHITSPSDKPMKYMPRKM